MKPSKTRRFSQMLVEESPLRRVDPRAKLGISLCASLAVMLPVEKLALFILVYLLLVAWARLLPEVGRQVWKIRWILVVLFLVDTWLVGLDLAITITLRVAMLTGVFALFFSTTTPGELCLALESLRFPYRYAFSLSLAMSSLGLLEEEWYAIREAQAARGVSISSTSLRELWRQAKELVALIVPAILLTTRRAWAFTEAAYSRGFDSPRRQAYHKLHFSRLDAVLLALMIFIIASLLAWR